MMTEHQTFNGQRLYVEDGLAFLAKHAYVDAWGQHKVSGTLFDLESGVVQRDAIAWCNLPAPEAEIVAGAFQRVKGRT
jgi:hypothetical protein